MNGLSLRISGDFSAIERLAQASRVVSLKPIMKISGEHVYRGSTSWGAPIATVKGEYVYRETGFLSAPVALIDGGYVYEGSTKFGGPIANVSDGDTMSGSGGGVLAVDVTAA